MSNGHSAEASASPSPAPSSIGNNAPKCGTVVPNRIFVGGISANTTEQDLLELFSKYGKVKATKVISDRAGVSKGYGFVTFETEEEAKKLTHETEVVMLKDRKLNIGSAIKKHSNEPFPTRLIDTSSNAGLLNASSVYFNNGQTYYAGTLPMITSPTEYAPPVAGVTHNPSHATFPAQSVTPSAPANGPTQTTGTAHTTGGYPTPFVYPSIYYPQSPYHQYQQASLQPQWAPPTGPPLRWIGPGSLPAQPEHNFVAGSRCDALSIKEGADAGHRVPILMPPPPLVPARSSPPQHPNHSSDSYDSCYTQQVETALQLKPVQKNDFSKDDKEGVQLVVNFEDTIRSGSVAKPFPKQKSAADNAPQQHEEAEGDVLSPELLTNGHNISDPGTMDNGTSAQPYYGWSSFGAVYNAAPHIANHYSGIPFYVDQQALSNGSPLRTASSTPVCPATPPVYNSAANSRFPMEFFANSSLDVMTESACHQAPVPFYPYYQQVSRIAFRSYPHHPHHHQPPLFLSPYYQSYSSSKADTSQIHPIQATLAHPSKSTVRRPSADPPEMPAPLQHFGRVTQLPDDRCALLPISPPNTPHPLKMNDDDLPAGRSFQINN